MLLSAYLKYKARSVAMMQTSCKCWTVSNWRFCRLWKILTFCKRAKKNNNVGLVIALNSGALALCVLTNLFCHQCLAVFKMVPFQDGGSMKLRQRRSAPTLEMDCEQNVFLGLLENISSNIYIYTKLLCLVEIVGTPVVNIVTECSRYHRKGIKVCVVSSQLSGLLGKQTIFNILPL